jgi:hypothetical protein
MASPDTGSRWKYLYQPLKADPPEMRLITLLPGPFSSQVQATLSTAPLHDPVSYEAISYAWGDPFTTAPILLDGIEFPITVNLESALRHFRLEEKSRLLWADAICLYVDRYQRKYHRNLRFGPLFSEGFRFAL